MHGDPAVIAGFGREAQLAARGRVHVPSNGASYLIDVRAGRRGHSARPLPPHLLASNLPDPWTEPELLRIWNGSAALGPQDESPVTHLLNDAPHFRCDPRRLYKTGARVEQKVARLLFRYPARARETQAAWIGAA